MTTAGIVLLLIVGGEFVLYKLLTRGARAPLRAALKSAPEEGR